MWSPWRPWGPRERNRSASYSNSSARTRGMLHALHRAIRRSRNVHVAHAVSAVVGGDRIIRAIRASASRWNLSMRSSCASRSSVAAVTPRDPGTIPHRCVTKGWRGPRSSRSYRRIRGLSWCAPLVARPRERPGLRVGPVAPTVPVCPPRGLCARRRLVSPRAGRARGGTTCAVWPRRGGTLSESAQATPPV